MAVALSACGSGAPRGVPVTSYQGASDARIVETSAHLECVPYAREASNIQIRGDAWTWWRQAEGRYGRGNQPAIGSVLTLSRSHKIGGGHLAVVTEILGPREIVVRHANWLNQGRIHLDTPVLDVSPANDWTLVRVWYTPGGVYGAGHYPAHGFIYPSQSQASRETS